MRVVLDSRLRLPLRSNLVHSADGDVLVFTRAKENAAIARSLRRAGVEVVSLAGLGSNLDLRKVVAELGRRELLSVILESGAILNSAALAAGIVDKMRVFFSPKVAGLVGDEPGANSASRRLWPMQELKNVTIEPFGPDFAIEGYLRDVYRTC